MKRSIFSEEQIASVAGLSGAGLSLSLNGGPSLPILANGNFVFPANPSARLTVTVASPAAGQTCSVSNATGASATEAVDDVRVICSSTTYTVRGAFSGLAAGQQVTLLNNGADPAVVAANCAYSFTVPVARNGGYAATVGTQPTGQTCTVANRQGINVTADVSNVALSCSATAHRIAGTVSGLAVGQQVTLTNNGADPITVSANRAFRFAIPLATQAAYHVNRGAASAGLSCSLTNASGSSLSGDVQTWV